MNKEVKIIIFILITMALNICAPLLSIKAYKDYSKSSYIYGESDKTVYISEFVDPVDYVYQENLSAVKFDKDEENNCYVFTYNFSPRDFDSTKHSYGVFINDYLCTTTGLGVKSISAQHKRNFEDITKQTVNSFTLDIEFEFYSAYSKLLLILKTNDISYFNSFRENPGIILTLSEVDPNIFNNTFSGNIIEDKVKTVIFEDDNGTVLSTYYIEQGKSINILPSSPTKVGYTFLGWSEDGENIIENITSLAVTDNVTYTAIYEQLPVTTKSFVATSWNIDNLNSKYIWRDGVNTYYSEGSKQYILNTATGNWITKTWNGLTEFYGHNIWTDGNNIYYSNQTSHYVLDTDTSTWTAKTWNGFTDFYGYQIWCLNSDYYYSNYGICYKLNRSASTWQEKTWIVYSDENGDGSAPDLADYIWTDGINTYYSQGTEQQVFDNTNSWWKYKKWNGLTEFYGNYIWTDGIKKYYSCGTTQYVLDTETSTWVETTWNINFNGDYIWTDGINTYYSKGTEQYKLVLPS